MEAVEEEDCVPLNVIKQVDAGSKQTERFAVTPTVNGVPVEMDLDTGAEASIAFREVWEQLSRPKLHAAPRLRAFGGTEVATIGQCLVEVGYKGRSLQLPLVFVQSTKGHGLFGAPWIRAFEAVTVNAVNNDDAQLSALLHEFSDVIEDRDEVGCIKGHRAHLYFKPDTEFRINKARPVPYAYRPLVEKELERLQQRGIITKVEVAEFTTIPLVVVPKPNGTVRVCGDFKVSLKPHLNVQQYPMPTSDEVFNKLAGGECFTKLDLADAYLQLELDEESRRYTVFTSHKGLFRVNHLTFGLSAAPAIF